jgi:cytochrome c556
MPHPASSRSRILVALPLAALALAAVAAPTLAASDPVATRTAGFKALGGAFKKLNDTLKSGSPDKAVMAASIKDIAVARKGIYSWFPAGSGPKPGVKTAAKPEIWSKPADFKAAEDGFAKQADALQKAVAGGNTDLISAEAKKLGGTCKTCHETFRVPHD